MQLGLNYYAYSKHFFCKIYVSVILQLSGMKLAIHNHNSFHRKKNSSNFCFKYNQPHFKTREVKKIFFFFLILGCLHTHWNMLWPWLALKTT